MDKEYGIQIEGSNAFVIETKKALELLSRRKSFGEAWAFIDMIKGAEFSRSSEVDW